MTPEDLAAKHAADVETLREAAKRLRSPYLGNWRTEVAHGLVDLFELTANGFITPAMVERAPAGAKEPLLAHLSDQMAVVRLARACLDEGMIGR